MVLVGEVEELAGDAHALGRGERGEPLGVDHAEVASAMDDQDGVFQFFTRLAGLCFW